MQIIYKIDLIFVVIYTTIILMLAILAGFWSGKIMVLLIAIGAIPVYLYSALKNPIRRYRATKQEFPEKWRSFLLKNCRFYRKIDNSMKTRFERDIQIFLLDYSIEGTRREPLDIETKLLVASGFATLLSGRPEWEPPIKDGVIVYPGKSFNQHYKIGTGDLAGQASVNSPLIVTKESLEESFKNPADGYNVIFHELAHYFDLEDGRAEGIPSTRLISGDLIPWRDAIAREWKRVLQGRSFLRPYAGKNEAELFAVATEFFFEIPLVMKEKNPELYRLLKDFYNVDAAEILGQEGDF